MENRGFARLFGDGENQVVVMVDTNDDGKPCVKTTFDPQHELLGLTSFNITFRDSDDGWKAAYDVMDGLIEKNVMNLVESKRQDLHKLIENGDLLVE